MQSIFFEISIVLIVGTLFAMGAKFFRQPLIPAYIIAGVVLGPSLLHIIRTGELLHTLSTFGIAFLLFLVGIELDLRKFLKTSRVAIMVGIVQMLFTMSIGYLLSRALGFEGFSAVFLSIALGFSSTIVVMKLLGERKELDTLYGQIVIGIMLTQDFVAIIFLLFFNIAIGEVTDIASEIFFTIVKGVFLFSIALLTSRYLLVHAFRYVARTPELLFLGAICWCLIFTMLSSILGFSIEIGSLLAGVSLSFLPYHVEIASRVKSLRDFFLPIFFATLGAQLVFSGDTAIALPTIIFSSLVLLITPIIVVLLLLARGYRSSTAFQTGTSIGQVSEFSFILVSLGAAKGLIDQDIVALVALTGLVTMTLSSYCIEYSEYLYDRCKWLLRPLERKHKHHRLELLPKKLSKHVVLFGYHTMGFKIREYLEYHKKPYIIVDYNPDTVDRMNREQIPHLYGNMSDDDILERVRAQDASLLISTVPNPKRTMELLRYVQQNNIRATVIVTAYHISDALDFYKNGAHFVIYPETISADFFSHFLATKLTQRRTAHIKELKHLQQLDFSR